MEAILELEKNVNGGIDHELDLIKQIDDLLAIYRASKEPGDGFMVRQYEHLRKKIIANLLADLRENYNLHLQLAEAA